MRSASLWFSLLLVVYGGVACGEPSPTDGGADPSPGDGGGPLAPPEVRTAYGVVIGAREEGAQAFLGIPYAAPPVGDARWRSPRPPEPWSEPRNATARPPRCTQSGFGLGASGQEDCLYLNVHTPDPRPEGAPVMVWIHGGGFIFGEGLQIDGGTAGDRLAAAHGVVVVSMNYRLGPFGFLAHPSLGDRAGGNFALTDQRAALEWVRDHIEAFGGDPDNVTIFGESAGGVSVCAHLVSPESGGLFHRAVTQSGLCDFRYRTRTEAEASGDAVVAALGCEGAADVGACLRGASSAAIVEADPARGASLGARVHWPLVDGEVLTGDFRERVRAGAFARVPTMVGWNADEGTLFVMLEEQAGAVADAATYERSIAVLAEETGVPIEAIRAQYPLEAYPEPGAALADALGHASLACPSRRAAGLLADAGAPVYVYRFDYPDAPFQLPPTRPLGAFHSAEIQYVFGRPANGRPRFRGDDLPLHQAMAAYWARFATEGDPNRAGAPAWPTYDRTGDAHLVLDRTLAAGSGPDAEACALWDR